MKQFSGIGDRIRNSRERMGLTLEQLARDSGCSEELLQSLEAGQYEKALSIFATLERIAVQLKLSPELLFFEDSSLFETRLNEMRIDAMRIMYERQLTNSFGEAVDVLQLIEDGFEEAVFPPEKAIHFRELDKSFQIDEERVRELLRTVRKRDAQ
ncbi:MAG: helix-turn-helix domain-containing protein [Planctomycetota bacterium]